MPDLVVAGAGMAGLAAAAQARQRGADVVVFEKGVRPGGAMLLSSGVVWRHRAFDRFRLECPGGDRHLQRLVFDSLDGDLAWLAALGAAIVEPTTRNPHTVGVRFDTASLTAALVDNAGAIHYGRPLLELPSSVPVVLATGGFAAGTDLVATYVTPHAPSLLLRSTPWSTGDGLRLGLSAGGRTSEGMDEFYGRAMPAPPARIGAADFVGAAQLYAAVARVESAGEHYTARTWSEIDVVQWMARRPRARATFTVSIDALDTRTGGRTVAEMVAAAERAGATVTRTPRDVSVEVVAGITTTLGGLAVDDAGRVAPGVFAAGADVGGIATGGYASGLAAALVLGRRAADAALGAR